MNKEYTVCRYCVATKGLKGSELKKRDLSDPEKMAKHIESEHNIPVRRPGETSQQAMKRFRKEQPQAGNPELCKCPECQAER